VERPHRVVSIDLLCFLLCAFSSLRLAVISQPVAVVFAPAVLFGAVLGQWGFHALFTRLLYTTLNVRLRAYRSVVAR
jgi:hypothetical protein